MSGFDVVPDGLLGHFDPPPELHEPLRRLHQQAFASLLSGRPFPVGEALQPAVEWLSAHDAVERDDRGRVTAVYGLVVGRGTPHSFSFAGGVRHTWCAFDAVGIPAALGVASTVRTTCPQCGGAITVEVATGRVVVGDAVLWLPGATCSSLVDDFCASANLFCTDEHLDAWRTDHGHPPGAPATLREAAELGVAGWAGVVS